MWCRRFFYTENKEEGYPCIDGGTAASRRDSNVSCVNGVDCARTGTYVHLAHSGH